VNVPADDEAGRITDPAIAVARGGFEAGLQAGTIAVTPVEDFAFVQEDRIVKPVLLDVGDERVELGALHQREEIGERVKLDRLLAGARFGIGKGVLSSLPSAAIASSGVRVCVGHRSRCRPRLQRILSRAAVWTPRPRRSGVFRWVRGEQLPQRGVDNQGAVDARDAPNFQPAVLDELPDRGGTEAAKLARFVHRDRDRITTVSSFIGMHC
jgi:hypothetical protein